MSCVFREWGRHAEIASVAASPVLWPWACDQVLLHPVHPGACLTESSPQQQVCRGHLRQALVSSQRTCTHASGIGCVCVCGIKARRWGSMPGELARCRASHHDAGWPCSDECLADSAAFGALCRCLLFACTYTAGSALELEPCPTAVGGGVLCRTGLVASTPGARHIQTVCQSTHIHGIQRGGGAAAIGPLSEQAGTWAGLGAQGSGFVCFACNQVWGVLRGVTT